MKLFLREITDLEKDYDFTESDPWVNATIATCDEDSDGALHPRSSRVHLTARKVDEIFVLTGDITTHTHLICSRCAAPFEYPMHPRFSALYSTDPVMAGIPRGGQTRGSAKSAHDDTDDNASSIDITHLKTDFIDLAELVAEQVRLQIPYQPLCRTDCKGMCTKCGTDLNKGRCACDKIAALSPFAVLRDHPASQTIRKGRKRE